ncbi:MAG: STAS domain-containing protein [Candidatus Auribacterota bacterium]|jgi:anti-sigma B factor antagonist|nr:STAS domain-containing protein [Candidatus Auribacterota bacterium]
MEIITKENIVSIVELNGELDNESAEELRINVEDLISNGKVNIILNFNELSYSNSAGLRELIALYKLANSKGGDLRLCSLQPQLEDLFSFTNLKKVFNIYPTEEDAVASFE